MDPVRAFFSRIQGRLLFVLSMLVAGMLAIWSVGALSLNRFAGEVSERIERLHASTETAARLEATVLEQIQVGERYLVAADRNTAGRFTALGMSAHAVRTEFTRVEGLTERERQQLARVDDLHARLEVQYALAHAERDLGRQAGAVARVGDADGTLSALKEQIRSLSAAQVAKVETASAAVSGLARQRQSIMLVMLVLTGGLGLVLTLRTLNAIDRPLARLIGAANQFGSGDLRMEVGGRMPSELTVLAGAFSGMATKLRTIVGETVATAEQISASASDLSSIAEEVAASSGEVSSAMLQITSGAGDQEAGLREVGQGFHEIRQRSATIAETAGHVRGLSERIHDLAELRRRDIAAAAGTLLEVREVVRASSAEVVALERDSEKIDAFVETIQGIARQTNLLALNAAIEAARAGQHGRGFAVVAEEVRKLADGSARAAEEVAATVDHIRREIQSVVATMDVGTAKVTGVETVSKGVETAFEEIIDAIRKVVEASDRMAAVADDNHEATAGIEGTVQRVEETARRHALSAQEVSASAQDQSAATEEMSAASVELLQAAERLKELVSGFHV
jgi:methyl-accepting chemotaxis protein